MTDAVNGGTEARRCRRRAQARHGLQRAAGTRARRCRPACRRRWSPRSSTPKPARRSTAADGANGYGWRRSRKSRPADPAKDSDGRATPVAAVDAVAARRICCSNSTTALRQRYPVSVDQSRRRPRVLGPGRAPCSHPQFRGLRRALRRRATRAGVDSLISDLETPVSAMLKLADGRPNSFLFESVEGGAARGRYSFIGLKPDLIWRCFGDRAEINRQARARTRAPSNRSRAGALASPARAHRRMPRRDAGAAAADGVGALRLSRIQHGRADGAAARRQSRHAGKYPTASCCGRRWSASSTTSPTASPW